MVQEYRAGNAVMVDPRPVTCKSQKATLSWGKTVWPAETKANLPLSHPTSTQHTTLDHLCPPPSLRGLRSFLSPPLGSLTNVVGKIARTPRRQQRPRLHRRPKSRRRPRPQVQSHSLLRHPGSRSNKIYSDRIRHQESIPQTQLTHPPGQERLQWRRRGFQDGCPRLCCAERCG